MADSYYDRLGVTPDATDDEIRRAWLRLARIHHPDAQPDPASRERAEGTMRSINEAWSVLGDPDRRRRYDDRRRSEDRSDDGARSSATVREPDPFVFVPFDDSPDDIDPRLLDDVGVEGTEVDRSVQFLPVVLLLGGILGTVLGVVIALPFLVGVGVVGLIGGALSFAIAPLQAISRSIGAERAAEHGRRR